MNCAFFLVYHFFGWPPCSCNLHHHHVLNKSLLAGNKRARKLVEGKYSEYFIAPVCDVHNQQRWADTRYGRAWLLKRFPRAEVEDALEEIRKCYKTERPELRYEALIAA